MAKVEGMVKEGEQEWIVTKKEYFSIRKRIQIAQKVLARITRHLDCIYDLNAEKPKTSRKKTKKGNAVQTESSSLQK